MEAHQKTAEAIVKIWQEKDYELLHSHLADPVEWYESPYAEVLKSPQDVIRQWRSDLGSQSDIKVKTDVLAIDGEKGCYHFSASWADVSRGGVAIDGIFLVELDSENKIRRFKQWYAIRPA